MYLLGHNIDETETYVNVVGHVKWSLRCRRSKYTYMEENSHCLVDIFMICFLWTILQQFQNFSWGCLEIGSYLAQGEKACYILRFNFQQKYPVITGKFLPD